MIERWKQKLILGTPLYAIEKDCNLFQKHSKAILYFYYNQDGLSGKNL